ncbi:MAG: tetratricopeptide repeat protein [Porticoccaceae bacterium]
MKSFRAALTVPVGAALLFLSCPLLAQAPVEDRTARSSGGNSGPVAQPNPNAQLIVEMQNLRQELSYLRGTVEELQYRIDELQEQQDQNYSDLDNRVRGLYTGEIGMPSGGSSGSASNQAARTSSSSSAASAGNNAEATALYQRGFEALRLGERAEAISAFDQLAQEHPQAAEVPDALYWLGETYWLANRREDSRQAFVRLLDLSPDYRKSDDAKYRLGVIYEQLGELDEARKYMQQVAQGNSSQAASAETWLDEHN